MLPGRGLRTIIKEDYEDIDTSYQLLKVSIVGVMREIMVREGVYIYGLFNR